MIGDLPGEYSFFFDRRKTPVRTVQLGQRFTVHTRDAVNGKIHHESVPFTAKSPRANVPRKPGPVESSLRPVLIIV